MSYSVENIAISFTEEEVEKLLCAMDYVIGKTSEFELEDVFVKLESALDNSSTKWYHKKEEN